MDSITSLIETGRPYLPYVVAGGTVVLAGLAISHTFTFRRYGVGSIKAPPNTAVIYQFGRGPYAPSMSPYPIKLETYCRLVKVPYMVDATSRFSARTKIPWMTYNGEIVEDSEMCIDYLNKKLGVDLNSHLNKEQRAVAKMIQVLVDEHLYWTLVLNRWIYRLDHFSAPLSKCIGVPQFLTRFIKKAVLKTAQGQGMGRHSQEEVHDIMMEDLRCLSVYLGDKRFMLGDRICRADCSVFGLLSQFIFHHFDAEDAKNIIEDNFPNLHKYILRIKEEVWPDWDENLTAPVYT